MTNGLKMPFMDLLATPLLKLKYLLTPCEDCWAWVTLDGEVYENVVVLKRDRDHVTIRHTYGTATIAKANLGERMQKSLFPDLDAAGPLDSYGLEGHELHAEALPMEHAESYSKVA